MSGGGGSHHQRAALVESCATSGERMTGEPCEVCDGWLKCYCSRPAGHMVIRFYECWLCGWKQSANKLSATKETEKKPQRRRSRKNLAQRSTESYSHESIHRNNRG